LNSGKKPDKRKLYQKIAFVFITNNQGEDKGGKDSVHNSLTKEVAQD
jgi:hypothetical protein